MKHDHKQSVRLWLELARIALPMSREMDKMLRSRFSQSLVRFDLMSQLARHEAGMPVSQLADKLLAATSGNISTLLDRMIAEDLVARQPVAGDRRMTLISLTAKGRRLFDEMSIVHAEWIAGQLSGLPASDKRAAITMLAQMQDKLAGPPAHKLAS
jgi:DNA-binding MarR family transcriptional regulator